jgi:LysM repeat protein
LVLPLLGLAVAVVSVLPQETSAEAIQAPSTYQVRPGDTLYGISAATGISVDELARINGLDDPDFILAGQTLRLAGEAARASSGGYLVQPGDTLSGIALANGVSADHLATLNRLSNLDLIVAGTMLDLPSTGFRSKLASGENTAGASRISWKGSPNYWAGRPHGPPIALVLHTADGALHGVDGEFATPASGLSTHFAVGLDGAIHQYVELGDRAWGNGYLEPGNAWPGSAGLSPNHLTVSIETEDSGNPRQAVTDAQYRATLEVGRLVLRYYPGIRYLITHRAIAPETRHDDPGPRWIASGRFAALANALGLKAID